MTNNEIQDLRKKIRKGIENGNEADAYENANSLIYTLYEDKSYHKILEIFDWNLLKDKNRLYSFELAYSCSEKGRIREAEIIYEYLLKNEPRNSSILNNLAIIKQENGNIDRAWDLISKAYDANPDGEIVKKNYENILGIIQQKKQIEESFKAAIDRLKYENDFVIEKLRNFVVNAKKDIDNIDNRIPIPRWKFKVLMQTDEQKANSLVDQWLEKNYIRRTGDRGNYQEHIYEINSYLETALNKLKRNKIPNKWLDALLDINSAKLDELDYYSIIGSIKKINKIFKKFLERDIDELFINYMLNNEKAVIVIAGSFVETLLIYYCEKKKIKEIVYSRANSQIRKRIYDANLGDLLSYFQEKRTMSDLLVHMANISRISRNFIHPGKELRNSEELNSRKAELCFLSALEIVKAICRPAR